MIHEIRKSMVLSTAHIPQELAEAMDMVGIDMALQRLSNSNRSSCSGFASAEQEEMLVNVSFDSINYGYSVWVPSHRDDNDAHAPPALKPVYDLARKLGCNYIVFDCDASKYDDLPIWDW
jgi:hypothetical protein